MKHQNLTQVSCQALMVSLLIGCLLFGGTRLTGNASAPTPSATVRAAQDSGKIAFVLADRVPTGLDNYQIYVINADGSGLRRLINNGRTSSYPAWSPDGRQIAFVSYIAEAEYSTINVMDADGSNERQLTQNTHDHISGLSWSPDGKFLAFSSDRHRYDEYAIYLLELATLDVSRLTYGSTYYGYLAWSPTGDVIAVEARFPGNWETYLINVDGLNARPITGKDMSWAPAWSPDGQRIAFTGDENNGSVVVVNKDGSGKKYLALDKAGRYPTWSPDGKSIAFVSGFDGTMYIMDADGTNLRRVLNTTGEEFSLAWQPSR